MSTGEKYSNPYQKRHDVTGWVDNVIYVDKKFHAEVNTATLQVYGLGISQAFDSKGKQKYPANNKKSLDFYWTISCILSGSGTLEVNNQKRKIKEGDIVVARPGISMKIIPDQGVSVKQFLLYLLDSLVAECLCIPENFHSFHVCHIEDTARIHFFIEKMLEKASSEQGKYVREDLSILAYSFLGELDRYSRNRKVLDKFNKILYSIRQSPQYYSSITVLMKEFSLSKRKLYELFEENLNMSPMQFVISEKLEKSRWYLINSAMRISDIAELCGYTNIPFFSREFKKKFRISPISYRKNFLKTGKQ